MIRSDWTFAPLADCCTFVSGGTPAKNLASYWQGDIPWVSPKDMNVRFIRDAEDHISHDGVEAGSRLVPKDTILIVVRSMTLANRVQIAITERDVAFNQDLKALICRDGIEPRFLFYALLAQADSLLHVVDEASHGTKRLRTDVLGQIEIPLPPLPEQRAIARLLSTLDNKIELNRCMNRTLEVLAHAFFRSWFIDFDPVHAKAEGRQPDKMSTTMSALFTDEFKDSDLGPIPADWEVKPLDEVATFLNGLALQKFPPSEAGSLPVIKIAELRRGITESSDRASAGLDARYIVHDGDVLFAWSGSLDACIWSGGTGALNQHLFKVTSNQYPKWFYYLWIRDHLPEFQAIAAGKATTMGHIQRHHLTQANVLVPPSDLIDEMSKVISPLVERQITNQLESRTLTQVRDALLPKLLIGEIRVTSAEKVKVKEAAV